MKTIKIVVVLAFAANCQLASGVVTTNYVDLAERSEHPNAYRDIQTAIDELPLSGDVVAVEPGTYKLSVPLTSSKAFKLIALSSDCTQTTIDGDCKVHCCEFSGNPTEIIGFTIQNGMGESTDNGSALIAGSICKVRNCLFTGNRGAKSAVYLSATGSSVLDSKIVRNESVGYGALNVAKASVVSNCTISTNISTGLDKNTCRAPGLVLSAPEGCRVVDCLIAENSATIKGAVGGGIYVDIRGVRDLLIERCIIRNNRLPGGNGQGSAFYGGSKGDKNVGISLTMRNCLIDNNQGLSSFYLSAFPNMKAEFCSCTFVNNSNTNSLFAFYNTTDNPGNLLLRNCLFYGNSSSKMQDAPEIPVEMSGFPGNITHSFTSNGRGLSASVELHNIVNLGQPGFVGYGEGDFRLKRSSGLVGVGCVEDWMTSTTDLTRTMPRLAKNGLVDIGCYQALRNDGILVIVR